MSVYTGIVDAAGSGIGKELTNVSDILNDRDTTPADGFKLGGFTIDVTKLKAGDSTEMLKFAVGSGVSDSTKNTYLKGAEAVQSIINAIKQKLG